METTDKNLPETLEIYSVDRVIISDKSTIDHEVVYGMNISYWMDHDNDAENRINRIFDLLFEEVIKDRGSG